jgi:NAD+ synthase (glutamine-hydrolysing)
MPIGDLVKGEVYALAELYNEGRELIPKAIIEKAPSAELAPDQKDQDTLPPYAELDKAVINVVEGRKAPSGKVEKWLVAQLARSEFKRWQAPPILRVSRHGFGRGRRLPIAGAPIKALRP